MRARPRATIPSPWSLALLAIAPLLPAATPVATRPIAGMVIETRGARLVVTVVTPGSSAARGGVKEGDVLLVVDDQPLMALDDVSPRGIARIIDRQAGRPIRLVVGRGASTLGLTFDARDDAAGPPVPPSGGLGPGADAPSFSARDLDGTELTLGDLRGRTVLLDFWASWCPPCRESVVGLRRIADQYGDRLVVVGVSLDEDPKAYEAFVYNQHLPGHQVHDGGPSGPIARAFGVPATGVPHVVLIGPDGKVSAVGRMAVDIEADIARLTAAPAGGRGGAD